MEARRVYEHVVIGSDGTARIGDTRMKVLDLVSERNAWGWSPEESLLNHPVLTLAQVYAALAFYEDHAAELDQELDRDRVLRQQLRDELGQPPCVERLPTISRR